MATEPIDDGGSLTCRLLVETFSALTGKTIKYANLCIYRDYELPRAHGPKQSQESKQVLGRLPLVYVCLTPSEFCMLDVESSGGPSSPSNKEARKSASLLSLPYRAIASVAADAEREDFFDVHLDPDVLAEMKIRSRVPEVLSFSCMHRKTVVENLQVCWNTAVMCATNRLASLPIRFVNDKADDAVTYKHPVERFYRLRLPASKLQGKGLFHRAGYVFLAPSLLLDKYAHQTNRPISTYIARDNQGDMDAKQPRLVVRFMPPQSISDSSSVTRSRDTRGHSPADDLELSDKQQHHQPGKHGHASSSSYDLSDTKDGLQSLHLGGYKQRDADAGSRKRLTIQDLAYGREYSSDLDFQLWVETTAISLAVSDAGQNPSKDFFIPSRGVYNKKANIVGDKSAWTCFRLHIHTRRREIGVIGVRRKYLPPYLDSFQDMLFVLYGKRHDRPAVKPVKQFMVLLDELVDSLSPSVAPVPFLESLRLDLAASESTPASEPQPTEFPTASSNNDAKSPAKATTASSAQPASAKPTMNGHAVAQTAANANTTVANASPNTRTVHRTYVDRRLVQSRADGFLYDQASYFWLSTRTWLKPTSGDGPSGVRPEIRFIDMECVKLAAKFVDSIKAKLPRDAVGDEDVGGTDAKRKPRAIVEDPLSILFRMQAELSNEASGWSDASLSLRGGGSSGGSDGKQSSSSSDRRQSQSDGSSSSAGNGSAQIEEWKTRVARYLAYCVDGGVDPDFNLVKLAASIEPLSMTFAELQSVDQVMDFLLYLKLRQHPTDLHAVPFKNANSIVEKLRMPGFLHDSTCNEAVLVRLLQTGYIEDVIKRRGNPEDPADLLGQFLASLLARDYNTELIQAVCDKIVALQLGDACLLAPLIELVKTGTLYSKTFAFHALAALGAKQRQGLYSQGAVGLAVWHIYVSKNAPLLQSCVEFLSAVMPDQVQPDDILCRRDFPKQLVQLLQVRVPYEATKGEPSRSALFRYPAPLLAAVASLITHLTRNSQSPAVLDVLWQYQCGDRLVEILASHRDYHAILPQVANALGLVYLEGGVRIFEIDRHKLVLHARTLLAVLSYYSTPGTLELCLFILIALRQLLKLNRIPESSPQLRVQRINDRLAALQELCNEGFDDILHRCQIAASDPDMKQRSAGAASGSAERQRAMQGVVKKCVWFAERIRKCKETFKPRGRQHAAHDAGSAIGADTAWDISQLSPEAAKALTDDEEQR